jgi:type IV pilus assembly protein PilA
MLTMLRKRLDHDEEGFTLIELMVVVLIIAILIAIAIPTFLGAQNRARDRGTQSDLRNALTAAKTIATDDSGLFTNVTTSSLTSAEGALTFVAVASASTSSIGVLVDTASTPQTALFVKGSASGYWFGMGTDSNGVVKKCKADSTAGAGAIDTYSECATVAGASGSNW